MNRQLSGAFDKWCEFTEESIEMRVKITRAIKKMMNRVVAGP